MELSIAAVELELSIVVVVLVLSIVVVVLGLNIAAVVPGLSIVGLIKMNEKCYSNYKIEKIQLARIQSFRLQLMKSSPRLELNFNFL